MGAVWKLLIIVGVLVGFLGYKISGVLKPPPPPKLEETWWGHGQPGNENQSIRPFQVRVSDEVLQDLKHRLDHARPLTPPLEGIQHQYGINTNLLKEIVDFWRTKYNWREREKLFNQYPQYITNIQGLDIHYIHVKPKATNVKFLPLLLLHGWPSSVREFFEAIPLLTTPQKDKDFVFEVIVPSVPGYGFSQGAVRPGLGGTQTAVIFKNLMERLGFEKYYVQGGDFGALVLHQLAVMYPEVVLGFHSNLCVVFTPLSVLKMVIGALWPTWFVREDHVDRVYPMGEVWADILYETGYLHIQATKPDTVGVALNDSPVGLAAYILEKLITATNKTYRFREDGGLKENFDYADILDNVMVYWITGTMPTSIRSYAETFSYNHFKLNGVNCPIKVPTACARFKNDFYSADSVLGEIYTNLLQLSDYEGGHFAAFEQPDIFTKDVILAVDKFENYHAKQNVKV